MSEVAEIVSRMTGTRINVGSPSADLIFGGIMAVLALVATGTYNLDLSSDSSRGGLVWIGSRLATFRRKIHLSRIEVIWNACWKDDTPPAIPAGCLVKSLVIFGVSSLPISR